MTKKIIKFSDIIRLKAKKLGRSPASVRAKYRELGITAKNYENFFGLK